MEDNLGRIFKEHLFETKKDPNRDWSKIANRAGAEMYEEVVGSFSHPEIALCATIHCLAELVMCAEKGKRSLLIERLKDAVRDRVTVFEGEEAEEAGETEDYPEEEGQEQEEVEYEDNQPGPEDEDDETPGDDEEDPDKGFPGTWMPNKGEKPVENPPEENPAKQAGYHPKKRQSGRNSQ